MLDTDDDDDLCDHEPDPDTLRPATGYSVAAEGGVVVEFRCRRCGVPGAALVRLDQLMW